MNPTYNTFWRHISRRISLKTQNTYTVSNKETNDPKTIVIKGAEHNPYSSIYRGPINIYINNIKYSFSDCNVKLPDPKEPNFDDPNDICIASFGPSLHDEHDYIQTVLVVTARNEIYWTIDIKNLLGLAWLLEDYIYEACLFVAKRKMQQEKVGNDVVAIFKYSYQYAIENMHNTLDVKWNKAKNEENKAIKAYRICKREQQRLAHLKQYLTNIYDQKETLARQQGEYIDSIRNSFQDCQFHSLPEELRVIRQSEHYNYLRVTTNPITIDTDIDTYLMGPYYIWIPIDISADDSDILIQPVDPNHDKDYIHPHVNSSYQCCFGSIINNIDEYLHTASYGRLIHILLKFLKSYNPDDAYWDLDVNLFEECFSKSTAQDCIDCSYDNCPYYEDRFQRCWNESIDSDEDWQFCIRCGMCDYSLEAINYCHDGQLEDKEPWYCVEDCALSVCTYHNDSSQCEGYTIELCEDCPVMDCEHKPEENNGGE